MSSYLTREQWSLVWGDMIRKYQEVPNNLMDEEHRERLTQIAIVEILLEVEDIRNSLAHPPGEGLGRSGASE